MSTSTQSRFFSVPKHWRTFVALVLEGQRVDWKHSLVIIVVITGMFSTPLMLGSIRSRVYRAVKTQIEKENNARQIVLYPASDGANAMDGSLVRRLAVEHPGVRVVGNHKLVVAAQGPHGADLLTAQTLVYEDPRQEWLAVEPRLKSPLSTDEVVLSDGLGRLLYGPSWDSLWEGGSFTGPPLDLRMNDQALTPRFRIVGRRGLPGQGLYLSPKTARSLRRYSLGFGALDLGLPVNEGLLAYALPKPLAAGCALLLRHPEQDSTCDDMAQERLARRFDERQWLSLPAEGAFELVRDRKLIRLGLTELLITGQQTQVRAAVGDCAGLVAPLLTDTCQQATIVPEIGLDALIEAPALSGRNVRVMAGTPGVLAALPEAGKLQDLHGSASPTDDALWLTMPQEMGLMPGDRGNLGQGEHAVPFLVGALYHCGEPMSATVGECPVFADVEATQRLIDLQAGVALVQSRSPLIFVPEAGGGTFDEILVYAQRVEDVEALAAALATEHPHMSVRYNVTALAKLARQDARLATLFTLTMALAALFIVLALGALTRLDVERRKRQLAQLLILGHSRRFVRFLIVAELLLLTFLASLTAGVATAGLCAAARALLMKGESEAGRDLAVIVSSMGLDGGAFVLVSAVVLTCTWVVAQISAFGAARTDPLSLLD